MSTVRRMNPDREEIARLREKVRLLEEERDFLRRSLLKEIAKNCREEDWADFEEGDPRIPFGEVLAELERSEADEHAAG